MPSLNNFYLNGAAAWVELETLTIAHPNFSQTYRVVRNSTSGLVATDELSVSRTYEYYPLRITRSKTSDDLDQSFSIALGDLGDILPKELDLVAAANAFDVLPTCVYRTYSSNDLTSPLVGPIKLEVVELPFGSDGVSFEARAPRLNSARTGEIYSIARFPMLRSLL